MELGYNLRLITHLIDSVPTHTDCWHVVNKTADKVGLCRIHQLS